MDIFLEEEIKLMIMKKYVRYFWEITNKSDHWHKYANAGGSRKYFGIEWYVVDWSENAKK